RRRLAVRALATDLPRRTGLPARAGSDRPDRRSLKMVTTPLTSRSGHRATTTGTSIDHDALDACLGRAVAHMRSIQHGDGYWWGELEANGTMAAEHVMLERVLG